MFYKHRRYPYVENESEFQNLVAECIEMCDEWLDNADQSHRSGQMLVIVDPELMLDPAEWTVSNYGLRIANRLWNGKDSEEEAKKQQEQADAPKAHFPLSKIKSLAKPATMVLKDPTHNQGNPQYKTNIDGLGLSLAKLGRVINKLTTDDFVGHDKHPESGYQPADVYKTNK